MAWRPFKRASGGEGSHPINSLKNEQGRGHIRLWSLQKNANIYIYISRVRCALWSLDGNTELRPIAYPSFHCGRCRIQNPCICVYYVPSFFTIFKFFHFFTFPFFMIFIYLKITFQKLFATHQKSARDPPVGRDPQFGKRCSIVIF